MIDLQNEYQAAAPDCFLKRLGLSDAVAEEVILLCEIEKLENNG